MMLMLPLGQLDFGHLPILLVIGFALFAGGLGAKLFQKLRIPQVVGYIVIGVLLGKSGIHFFHDDAIARMRLFNFFALGVIGFMIGGELRLDVFRRYGKQLLIILFSEGLTAFVFVSMATFGIAAWLTGETIPSLALGLVLGAIASATAPAATVDVLWEYKTKGPLTTSVFALVALDDGLALVLYGIASSIARMLTGLSGGQSTLSALGHTAYELGGALVLGVSAGFLLNYLLRVARDHDKALTFILGTLVITIGVALMLTLDVILGAMALGMTLVNLAPRRSRESFGILERFTPPIYVLFFVIVGARLSVGEMQGWMWALAAAFVIGRSGGKILGAFLGAKWARASQAVQRYLGLCLFSQAGVAIGLAILTAEKFGPSATIAGVPLGSVVVLVVTATTFIVQIIGPPCVKLAVQKAGEVGVNVTRDDLIGDYCVRDTMSADAPTLSEGETFPAILRTLNRTEAFAYPVVDQGRSLLGVVTLQTLKMGLVNVELSNLLVASDLMQPAIDTISPDAPLLEAITRMGELDLDYLYVVTPTTDKTPPQWQGLLDRRHMERQISQDLLRRQNDAANKEQTDLLRAAILKKKKQIARITPPPTA